MQTKGKVTPIQDELGNVIRVSKNNPEFGHVRLQQERVTYTAAGWVKRSNLTTLLHGKVEDLEELGIASAGSIPGKIIVKESTTPFNESDPDRDLKIAGETGIVCCAHGEPIYRKTFLVPDENAIDELVAHTNGDAIKEANEKSNGAKSIAADEFSEAMDDNKKSKKKKASKVEETEAEATEEISDETDEDLVEAGEDLDDNDEGFEL